MDPELKERIDQSILYRLKNHNSELYREYFEDFCTNYYEDLLDATEYHKQITIEFIVELMMYLELISDDDEISSTNEERYKIVYKKYIPRENVTHFMNFVNQELSPLYLKKTGKRMFTEYGPSYFYIFFDN